MFFDGVQETDRQLRSQELYMADNVPENLVSSLPEHAVDRYVERVGRGRKIFKKSAAKRIGECLTSNYKRAHYIGQLNTNDHGKVYYYIGCKYGNKFVIPQSYLGCVYTILPWTVLFNDLKEVHDKYVENWRNILVEESEKNQNDDCSE